MPGSAIRCPLTRSQLIDEYFLENRSRILEIAAFLDRLDRAAAPGETPDVRVQSLQEALRLLSTDAASPRVAEIQMVLSHRAEESLDGAEGKGGGGALEHRGMEVE